MSPEIITSLDAINVNMNKTGMDIINIVLAFVMFGVALGIKLKALKEIVHKPKSIIVGMLLQWFALPAVTFAIAMALSPYITPMIALGMILIASCPGGNISNFLSALSNGNIALSVSLTATTTAMSPIITPLNFFFWGNLYSHLMSIKNDIPQLVIPFFPMLEQIMLLLGLPVVLGLLF